MTARDYPIQDDSDTESSTEWAQWWLQSNVTMDTTTMVVAANDNDDFWFSPSPPEDIFIERIEPIATMNKHQIPMYENQKISSKVIWMSSGPHESTFAECIEPIITEVDYHNHSPKHENPKRPFHGENHFVYPMHQMRGPIETMDTYSQVQYQREASEVSDDSKHGINAAVIEHNGAEYTLENKIPRSINMMYSNHNHPMRSDPKPNLCAKSRTSYNFFFNHERHRVLQHLMQTQHDMNNNHLTTKFPLEDFFATSLRYYSDRTIWTNNNVPLQDLILQQHWNQNRDSKRKRNKSEKDGIPYREMRQHISKVWRLLPSNAKDVFSLIAVKDLQHSLRERRNPTK